MVHLLPSFRLSVLLQSAIQAVLSPKNLTFTGLPFSPITWTV